MKSKSRLMLEKSISAMLSAIEIYNKPDFKYREETFSVLCINSWELLLKSKVLNLSSNNVNSLLTTEYRILKNGSKSKNKFKKKNRSGNFMSISMYEAYRIITEDFGVKLDKAIIDNLLMLTEIRDNSIHFVNDDLLLSLKVQELGTASLQNYLNLVKNWFGNALTGYNFYLMPISFFRDFDTASVVTLNANEKRVLSYIKSMEEGYDDEDDIKDYNLTLSIDVKFQKVKSTTGVPVQVTQDQDAQSIRLSEEDMTEKYPWDYEVLTTRLKKRYNNFSANAKYHKLRKALQVNYKFGYERLFDPSKPLGSKKVFFNPNIQKEFDKHYTKKDS